MSEAGAARKIGKTEIQQGIGPADGTRTEPDPQQGTEPGDGPGKAIASFRSLATGHWVSAEVGYGGQDYGMLRGRAGGNPGAWERFRLVYGNNAVALQSVQNGLYVSAEIERTGAAYGMLRARSRTIGKWERFQLGFAFDGSGASLESMANQRYVSAEAEYTGAWYGMLRARASSGSGRWEKFEVVFQA